MQSVMERLSSVLEMAGSLRPVLTTLDRDRVVADTCSWYCLGRSRPAFDRFDMLLFQICYISCKCRMVAVCYVLVHIHGRHLSTNIQLHVTADGLVSTD